MGSEKFNLSRSISGPLSVTICSTFNARHSVWWGLLMANV